MKLYFVRHGETDGNLQERGGNFFDGRLNDNGRRQVRWLGLRIAAEPVDLIIASPYKRTMETAVIIAGIAGKEVRETALLEEKKWPGEIEGKLLADPEAVKLFDLMREKNNSDPNWHYRDEENFLDVKKRAQLFIEYANGLDQERVLAVSHEYFIKLVIAAMIFGDRLTYDIFRRFFHSTSLANASRVLCEKENGVWKLISLNY